MAAIACLAVSSTAPAEALDLEGGKVYGFVAKTGSYYMTAGTFYFLWSRYDDSSFN